MAKKLSPPAWALTFLRWYCDERYLEEIEGDLMETFKETRSLEGPGKANQRYVKDVFRFFRFNRFKHINNPFVNNSNGMFKNNLIVAYRNLIKKKAYSAINILGLSVGIACCTLIAMYVNHELGYDKFQNEDVYRIGLNRIYPDRETGYTIIPHSIGPQMVIDFPEVEAQARVLPPIGTSIFRFEDKSFNEPYFLMADSNVFEVIDLPLIEGNPANALTEKNTIILSETTAKKYFGNDDPIGKTLESPFGNFMVTAIAKDYPDNSHFKFDIIASIQSAPFISRPIWAQFTTMTYLRLTPGADPSRLEAKFPGFVKTYAAGQIEARTKMSFDEYIAAGNGYDYFLQPIQDIHLTSNLENEIRVNGNATYVTLFIFIAGFILIIACINFMNLSTARSIERAKEVGIRKVLGSLRKQLVIQFLTESVIISTISLLIGVIMVYLVLPLFSNLAERPLDFEILYQPYFLLGMIGGTLFIGLIAGFYPAVVLSAFIPVNVLKGKMKTSKAGVQLRNGLVIFQFMVSVVLISSTLVIYDQMQYMINKNLGFDKEQVIVLKNTNTLNDKVEPFKESILGQHNIHSAAMSSAMPGDFYAGFSMRMEGQTEEGLVARQIGIDEDFLEAMKIKLIAGRNFSDEFVDSLSIIVNQSLVDELNLADPIGKHIIDTGNDPSSEIRYRIIGVIEDYHYQSLHTKIDPQVLIHTSNSNTFANVMAVKVSGASLQNTLSHMEQAWGNYNPNTPFEYYFLDNNLREFYSAERTSGEIFSLFTVLAILIACIGLLGLSSYTISQKTKEIGVRKVMGASVFQIMFILSKDFTLLIMTAIVIAIPLSYYYMNSWLNDFAYRIDINWLTFLLSGVAALIIAWITVSYQSIKAARMNPVKTLRYE